MPNSYMDRASTGFVRTTGPNDDVVSVISQARSLLNDGRLNSSMHAAYVGGGASL